MRRSYLARVIFIMAVLSMSVAKAGWFGNDEPEPPKKRGRRESEDERRPGQEDTVEYEP